MFTGIIETSGIIRSTFKVESNIRVEVAATFIHELRVDQSISHNGICLTVKEINNDTYFVDVVEETLKRTDIELWQSGYEVNLERSLKLGERMDGHLVQGHIDCKAKCVQIEDRLGSWNFTFNLPLEDAHLVVKKGSICINGVSLTVVSTNQEQFVCTIIPYTFYHTNFKNLRVGSLVNFEFDIIGKYISGLMQSRN